VVLTLHLLQHPDGCVRKTRRDKRSLLVQIVFQGEILCDKDRLTVFLDHVKVVRRIYLSLKEDAIRELGIDSMEYERRTHVLTAYLKNSVTNWVEPLRVIAWRLACLEAISSRSNATARYAVGSRAAPPVRGAHIMSAATPTTNAQSPAPSPQPDSSNPSVSAVDRVILDYLKTRGHSAAEKALREELGHVSSDEKGKQRETASTDELVQSLAVFASKIKSGENALKDSSAVLQELGNIGSPANLQNLISSIGAVGAEEILSQDPTDQHEGFRELEAWVDGSLDMYRVCATVSLVDIGPHSCVPFAARI
jgi:hypothetical protein